MMLVIVEHPFVVFSIRGPMLPETVLKIVDILTNILLTVRLRVSAQSYDTKESTYSHTI